MRYFEILLGLSAILLICRAAPVEDKTPESSQAVELLGVDSQTTHENESIRRARQYYYNPFGGFYSGYGYGGYGGYYGGYGGYGLYGYGRYPYSGYGYGGYSPYYGGYSYYG